MSNKAAEAKLHPAPADQTDFNPIAHAEWSQWVDLVFDMEINPTSYVSKTNKEGKLWTDPDILKLDPQSLLLDILPESRWANRLNLNRFYNPFKDQNHPVKVLPGVPIRWHGFPRTMEWGVYEARKKDTGDPALVLKRIPEQWKVPEAGHLRNIYWAADNFRIFMDEYLEWAVQRDPATDKITKVIFTCEGPEYWRILAKHQPDTVVKLYRDFNPGENITKEDLYDENGYYIPDNQWNSPSPTNGCIAHLIQPNSRLADEIDIVAQGTILRDESMYDENGDADEDELIECAAYGEKKRDSDPKIGHTANVAVKQNNFSLSIEEPIGLYINSTDSSKISAPDGYRSPVDGRRFNPEDCWKIIRGTQSRAVRVEFSVPKELYPDLVVGDLIDENQVPPSPFRYGSQLAVSVTISVTASCGELSPEKGSLEPVTDRKCYPRDKGDLVEPDEKKEGDEQRIEDEYDIIGNKFLTFMQWKGQKRAKNGEQPWLDWFQKYQSWYEWLVFEKPEDGNLGKEPHVE
ncbi:hypothetical protein ABW19_dt0209999 [Dactylella cylindrospora]|nr:hypothetical protein ABW19_dt0209999 [Dactylella cylindrospora]